ncbi:heat shock 70 kDa protein 12A-like [Montipora capricornis]|uniref:heat shock 70 kDa protein 12A-like n=1 Tax=Montipora capricornis TaxID=246305 RepID=UPI0035F1F566
MAFRVDPLDFKQRLRLERNPFNRNRAGEYDVVVSIDFGTSFSGFAYSFNHEDGSEDIYMNRAWGSAQGFPTHKTPTCLLLNPGKKFVEFGYEAAEKYAELEDDEDRSFYFFDRFKMLLHGSEETLSRNTLLEARNGKQVRALDIFSYSLEYLKDKALERISDESGIEYTAEEVRWVITVPAIWKQSAKQFMREAAYQAGLIHPSKSSQLIIALEPEAAAIFCRQSKLREFVEGKGREQTVKDAFVPAKTQYLVVDNGGGTVDVTAHEVDENDDIKEIYHATGGDFGGTKVDEQFENLLTKIFGEDFMSEFCRTYPSDWLDVMNDFEVKKRSDRVIKGEVTRIRLPANFIFLLRQKNGKDHNRIIRPHYKDDQVKISKEYLCLGSEIVETLFEPAITSIIDHLKSLLKKKVLKGVRILFLVGGFSESPLLQARIKEEFKAKYKILIPNDAQTAVVKGAVMFGKRPSVVVERCLSDTYGTGSYRDFIPGFHKLEKLERINGKAKCKDIFSVLARENDVVRVGQCKTVRKFHPLRPNQTEVLFDFFTSTDPNVVYITDTGVRKLPGLILIKSPDTSKGTEREIKLELYFNTEIKVVGIDVETGNEESTFIDFLSYAE